MSLKEYDAVTGTPTVEALPDDAVKLKASIVSYGSIDLSMIAVSATNPRTSHGRAKLQQLLSGRATSKEIIELLQSSDAADRTRLVAILGSEKLTEFVASIAMHGVNQPVLVRPLPADRLMETSGVAKGEPRPVYELIAGERRYFASRLAGKSNIPAMIKTMSNQEVLEFQLIENLQREDLHPLEEAEGYLRLCDTTGIRKDEIAGKIGKSRSYVYQRLKLVDLSQESREAFYQGKLDSSRAELLATIADPKLQLKALKEFTEEQYAGRVKSVRECREWLQRNILLKIDDAPFDTADSLLLASCRVPSLQGATACSTCPKRTHADRDLFAAFDGPDMCTDPVCFHAKEEAHVDRIRAEAEAKGLEVIVGKEAKKLKPSQYGTEIKGYTRLDSKIDGESVSKLLGKDAPKPVLFVDPHTHQMVKVLPEAAVNQVLKAKGVIVKTTKSVAQSDEQRAAAAAKERAALIVERTWRASAAQEINSKIRSGALSGFSFPLLRRLCEILLESGDSEFFPALVPLWDLPASTKDGWAAIQEDTATIRRHIQAAPDGDLPRMALTLMFADELSVETYTMDHPTPTLDLIAAETGVDLAAIRKAIEADLKAATKNSTPPGTKVKAAPQGSVAAKEVKAPTKPAAKKSAAAPARRAKLSEAAAKQGIAEAMQQMGEPAVGGAKPGAIAKGASVKVNDTANGKNQKPWVGQTGEVIDKQGDSAWAVMFPGKKGGAHVVFDASELVVMA